MCQYNFKEVLSKQEKDISLVEISFKSSFYFIFIFILLILLLSWKEDLPFLKWSNPTLLQMRLLLKGDI